MTLLAEDLRVPAKMGRPTIYTPELAQEICLAVSKGLPLFRLCDERADWPERGTIYRWATERADFRDMFTRARELKAHLFSEEMLEIAEKAAPESVRVAELQIKTRQWLAGKLSRADYGDQAPQLQVNQQFNVQPIAQQAESKLEQILEGSAKPALSAPVAT